MSNFWFVLGMQYAADQSRPLEIHFYVFQLTNPTKTFGICRYQFILKLITHINIMTLLIDKLRIEERNVVK